MTISSLTFIEINNQNKSLNQLFWYPYFHWKMNYNIDISPNFSELRNEFGRLTEIFLSIVSRLWNKHDICNLFRKFFRILAEHKWPKTVETSKLEKQQIPIKPVNSDVMLSIIIPRLVLTRCRDSLFAWHWSKMFNFNCCRYNFFCCSLRTACYIFGILDVIVCILAFFIFIHHNTVLQLIASISAAIIWPILLYFGIYQQRSAVLWIVIVMSVISIGCAISIFSYLSYYLIALTAKEKAENPMMFLILLVFISLLFFNGLLIVFFVTQIFVIRNYQIQLSEQKLKKKLENRFEVINLFWKMKFVEPIWWNSVIL